MNNIKKMILIDDKQDLLDSIKDYFEGKYNVFTFNDSRSALIGLEKIESPSIIVTDQIIPNSLNGLDLVLALIQKFPSLNNTIFMIMSAFTGERDEAIQAASKQGLIDGFISKPFKMNYFESRIEDAFSKHEMIAKLRSIEREKQQLVRQHKDLEARHETLVSINKRRVDKEEHSKMADTNKKAAAAKQKKAS